LIDEFCLEMGYFEGIYLFVIFPHRPMDSKNIKFSSDLNHGVVDHVNTLEYSKWGLKLTDALWDGDSVFKTYHSEI